MDCPTCAHLLTPGSMPLPGETPPDQPGEVTRGESVEIEREGEPNQIDTSYTCSNGHSWTHSDLVAA